MSRAHAPHHDVRVSPQQWVCHKRRKPRRRRVRCRSRGRSLAGGL